VTKQAGLEQALSSHLFVRQIFEKVNFLRAAAKKGKTKRDYEAALPIWGVDIQAVTVMVWSPNKYNSGGICITYGKKPYPGSHHVQNHKGNYMFRLYKDLTLWTGIRTWSVYDGEPLWP